MKLTTPRIFLAMMTLTIVCVLGALIYLHEREPPPGPNTISSIIGAMRKRSAARTAKARQSSALELENVAFGDGGVPSAADDPASGR